MPDRPGACLFRKVVESCLHVDRAARESTLSAKMICLALKISFSMELWRKMNLLILNCKDFKYIKVFHRMPSTNELIGFSTRPDLQKKNIPGLLCNLPELSLT